MLANKTGVVYLTVQNGQIQLLQFHPDMMKKLMNLGLQNIIFQVGKQYMTIENTAFNDNLSDQVYTNFCSKLPDLAQFLQTLTAGEVAEFKNYGTVNKLLFDV